MEVRGKQPPRSSIVSGNSKECWLKEKAAPKGPNNSPLNLQRQAGAALRRGANKTRSARRKRRMTR